MWTEGMWICSVVKEEETLGVISTMALACERRKDSVCFYTEYEWNIADQAFSLCH